MVALRQWCFFYPRKKKVRKKDNLEISCKNNQTMNGSTIFVIIATTRIIYEPITSVNLVMAGTVQTYKIASVIDN